MASRVRARACALAMLVSACAASCSGTPAPPPSSPPPTGSSTEPAPPAVASTAAPVASAPAPSPPATRGTVLVGDINAPKSFDPRPAIAAMQPAIVDCYDKVRATRPDLHGKLTLHINVNEAGAVLGVDADPSGRAFDPALVACISDAMKAGAHFPKPGGAAIVNAPIVLHP